MYNTKSSKTLILDKEYMQTGIGKNRILGVLLCIRALLKKESHWNMNNIAMLFDKYENIEFE
ncbi:hypothetical protein [Clostridium neonatale]|nr:hypothetical protein [Clostridium neonatale]CAI3732392.1 hypothetical protein CNEO4_90045 [Clostridium neonatale]